MPKTAKRTPSRQNEFLEVARALFEEKGFENTSVDDIVTKMGVAKGLFYYYFDSKEQLLAIIFDRMIDEVHASITAAMEGKNLTAMERFKALMPSNSDITSRSKKLIDYFHQERNQALHFAMESRSRKFMVPAMEQVIRQGVEEGVFRTEHPRESAVALLSMLTALRHDLPPAPTAEQWYRLALVAQEFSERLLGASPGTFDIFKESLPPELRAVYESKKVQ